MRTFIAIDTPEDIKLKISEVQYELKNSWADVKWESSNKFHITIKFLGEIKEFQIGEIIESIRNVANHYSRFKVKYKNLGCFPNLKNPRVIWIGCEDLNGTLEKIKNSLDEELKKYGFEIEDRKFHPHITLGRVKSSKGIKNLLPIIENLNFDTDATECRGILLMKSDLKPTGSEYTIIKSIELK